jgi:hypothetical protein
VAGLGSSAFSAPSSPTLTRTLEASTKTIANSRRFSSDVGHSKIVGKARVLMPGSDRDTR